MDTITNETLWATHFPEFFKAGETGINSLMASAKLVTIPAEQQVFYPGAACEHYLLVLEGSVKAQIISAGGREMLLYRVRSGDSCVLTTSCLLSGDITQPKVLPKIRFWHLLFLHMPFIAALSNRHFFANLCSRSFQRVYRM